MSLSLVSGKLAFLHDGYIAAIENCCVPMIVKCTLFAMCAASFILGPLFNMVFATRVIFLLGALFIMKL